MRRLVAVTIFLCRLEAAIFGFPPFNFISAHFQIITSSFLSNLKIYVLQSMCGQKTGPKCSQINKARVLSFNFSSNL